VQLSDLTSFVIVAEERSFSQAARRLHRTQPAISQAIRRLEEELGDRLFDRASKTPALTEAGVLLREHAERLLRLAADASSAVRELHEVRRGRVVIGANEAAVHSVLPWIRDFAVSHPQVTIEVRRVAARRIASELHDRALDFGVLTFQPGDKGLHSCALGSDEVVLLVHPQHPLGTRRRVSIEEVGRQVVIAHNEPSPTRERVLRLYERKRAPINVQISLPSLDGIKRAVELGVGVAVLPRRCALTEIQRGDLVAVKVRELSARKIVRLVYRRSGERSHAAAAFLNLVRGGGQAL
jgi:DNA-binding transcriptional LysR family regulator